MSIDWIGEMVFHGRITDGLPETHPLANEQIYCVRCDALVHAFNNECMRDWVEFKYRALCYPCFHETHPANSEPPDFDAFEIDDVSDADYVQLLKVDQ
jgi:hypothetical protein